MPLKTTTMNKLTTFLSSLFASFLFVFSINAQVLWSDDFSTPSNWSISIDGVNSAGWEFTTDPSVIPVGDLSPMGSTTASNGFLFVNSDGNNVSDFEGTPIVTTVTNTTPIDLSGYADVQISFEHNYRWWQDTRGFRVSTDNGATWTEYQLTCGVDDTGNCLGCEPNDNYPGDQNSGNPTYETVNISDVAGNQSQVLIQFYYNDNDYWAWYWAIDDVSISVLPSYDASLDEIIVGSTGSYGLPLAYYQIPISQVSPINFSGVVSNIGTSDFNATLTADLPGAFNSSSNAVNILSGTQDTLIITDALTPPAAVATHTVDCSVSITENEDELGNNSVSHTFEVNNFIYARDMGVISGGSYNQGDPYEIGNVFDIYSDATIHSIDIVAAASSQIGAEVSAKLYSIDPATGDFVFINETDLYALTESDLGVSKTYPLFNPELLTAGTSYLVVASTYGDGGVSNDLVVATAGSSPPSTSYYLDGNDNTWYYIVNTPMVRMNFEDAENPCEGVFEGTDVVFACTEYTWIDGVTYTANNNSATYVLQTQNGCDSTVTLDLTLYGTTVTTDVQSACDSYTWIDGNTYTTSNNSASFTLQSENGCDSIITLNLNIYASALTTDVQATCESFTWIDGNTYLESNNTATYVLQTENGCDSTIALDLTIYGSTETSDFQATCIPYTWIDGIEYTESNNTASFMLQSVNGCDSLITLDLTISDTIQITDVQTSCGDFIWTDGNTYTETNNTATQTLLSVSGCDSIVTLDLTIYAADSSIDVQTSCGPYTWIDGEIYSESVNGVTFVLQTVGGCDSTVTLDLTVNALPDVQIDNTDGMLTVASGEGLVYDWVDCATGVALGQTDNVFSPAVGGSYLVMVLNTENGCMDTSECETIEFAALEEVNSFGLNIYPNPSNGLFNVELNSLSVNKVEISVLDVSGKVISKNTYQTSSSNLNVPMNISNVEEGVYFVRIDAGRIITSRVIVSHK